MTSKQLNVIHATSADTAWMIALSSIVLNGDRVSPRSMGTTELRSVQILLEDPCKNVVTIRERKLNYAFMAAEWLWMISGRNDVGMISTYCKNIAQFSDDGRTFFGAYGPPIVNQLDYVLETLRQDPDSRQALLTIWRQNPPATKDVPCTVSMQFMIRDDRLEAFVYMRSSDVWLGLPYDLYNFTMTQKLVATELGVTPGCLRLWLASSHLYERNQRDAAKVLTMAPSKESPQGIAFKTPERISLFDVDAATAIEALSRFGPGTRGQVLSRWSKLSAAGKFIVGPLLRHNGRNLGTGWAALEEHHAS